jgi:serine O-acetyltransferase
VAMREEEFWRQVRRAHPGLREAVVADAAIALRMRGEAGALGSRGEAAREILRLALVSDAFLAQALYRVKARLQRLGVPLLPRLAHRLAIIIGQLSIGDPVVLAPGAYIPHGQVVIDGIVQIGTGVVLAPFVTIGLRAGSVRGPTIDRDVQVGSGARVLGAIHVGAGAQIGANAVVTSDVAAGATVVGIPARHG